MVRRENRADLVLVLRAEERGELPGGEVAAELQDVVLRRLGPRGGPAGGGLGGGCPLPTRGAPVILDRARHLVVKTRVLNCQRFLCIVFTIVVP